MSDSNPSFIERADALSSEEASQLLRDLQEKLRQSKASHDKNGEGFAFLHMAMIMISQRRYDEHVLHLLSDAQLAFIDTNNTFGLGCVRLSISQCHRESNRNNIALQEATEAVRLLSLVGESVELAWAYDNLARIYLNRLQRHESLSWAKKAQNAFSKLHSRLGTAWNMCNLGGLYAEMGFHAEAAENFQQALSVFEDLHHKAGRAWVALGLGMLCRARCDFPMADNYLEKAQMLFEELNLPDRAGWCVVNRAAVQRLTGHWDEALTSNKKAMRIFASLRNNDGVGWALFQMGQIANDRGAYVKSWETLREALNLHTHIASPVGTGWGENEMGRVYLNLANLSLARESFVKVKVTADQIDSPALKASVDANLASYYLDQGMIRKSFDSLQNAEATCEKIGAHYIQIEILLCRARYALVIHDLPMMRACVDQAKKIIDTFGLSWIKSKFDLVQAELLICDGKPSEAAMLLRSVEVATSNTQLKHINIEARLARIQLVEGESMNGNSMLPILEKNTRLIGSRKLRAKSLAQKAAFQFKKTGQNDVRLQAQVLDYLNQSHLVTLRWQCLSLFSMLCMREGLDSVVEQYNKDMAEMEADTSFDLRIADRRINEMQVLPVSIIS